MEPHFYIRAATDKGEMKFHCTGENTELYIHHPNFKEVDHLFHRLDESDRRLGGFVWRHILGEEEFERIAMYMHESGAFQITYKPQPAEGDFEEYLHSQSGDIPTN